ncbi:MAG: YitT family protein [Treponema sp.]|nr:YitT family protein [Treponema sp.]
MPKSNIRPEPRAVRTRREAIITLKRFSLVTAGAILMAFNINTFVQAGGLIPGGFTGLTLLIQEICLRYGGFRIPFSVVLYVLNAVPAVICYRFIGKKFALYSCLMVVISGLLTDWMPSLFIDFLQLRDTLLSAVFGGLLNAVSVVLCLYADATSGGTDFIAIFISEKYRRDAWNYIFAGNCVVLALAGFLFSPEKALYSIIFQFTTTMTLGFLYKAYQLKTLLIITDRPRDVYTVISEKTHHGATAFAGTGLYNMEGRTLLYSVVYANEVPDLVNELRKVDPGAFLNVIKTEQLNGRFFRKPKD